MSAMNGTASIMSGPDFVRSRPVSMSIDDVLAEAEQLGIPINRQQVHNTRYQMRLKAEKAKAERAAAKGEKTKPPKEKPKRRAPGEAKEAVFEFLVKYHKKHGSMPKSSNETARLMGMSENFVRTLLRELKADGRLTFEEGNYGTMAIVEGAKTPSSTQAVLVPQPGQSPLMLNPSSIVPPVANEVLLHQFMQMRAFHQERADAFSNLIKLYGGE